MPCLAVRLNRTQYPQGVSSRVRVQVRDPLTRSDGIVVFAVNVPLWNDPFDDVGQSFGATGGGPALLVTSLRTSLR